MNGQPLKGQLNVGILRVGESTPVDPDKNKVTVIFINDDASILQELKVNKGETPVYSGPELISSKQNENDTYIFLGWTPEISSAENNIVYMATYESDRKYAIKFVNTDGTILQEDMLKKGETPVYRGDEPIQEDSIFEGWEPEISEVTDSQTYTAKYRELPLVVNLNKIVDEVKVDLFTGPYSFTKTLENISIVNTNDYSKLIINDQIDPGSYILRVIASDEYMISDSFTVEEGNPVRITRELSPMPEYAKSTEEYVFVPNKPSNIEILDDRAYYAVTVADNALNKNINIKMTASGFDKEYNIKVSSLTKDHTILFIFNEPLAGFGNVKYRVENEASNDTMLLTEPGSCTGISISSTTPSVEPTIEFNAISVDTSKPLTMYIGHPNLNRHGYIEDTLVENNSRVTYSLFEIGGYNQDVKQFINRYNIKNIETAMTLKLANTDNSIDLSKYLVTATYDENENAIPNSNTDVIYLGVAINSASISKDSDWENIYNKLSNDELSLYISYSSEGSETVTITIPIHGMCQDISYMPVVTPKPPVVATFNAVPVDTTHADMPWMYIGHPRTVENGYVTQTVENNNRITYTLFEIGWYDSEEDVFLNRDTAEHIKDRVTTRLSDDDNTMNLSNYLHMEVFNENKEVITSDTTEVKYLGVAINSASISKDSKWASIWSKLQSGVFKLHIEYRYVNSDSDVIVKTIRGVTNDLSYLPVEPPDPNPPSLPDIPDINDEKYTISFVDNKTGEVLQTQEVTRGEMPVFNGTPPTKEGATFVKWYPNITSVYRNATYRAIYSDDNIYTIKFFNRDGTTLLQEVEVPEGVTPECNMTITTEPGMHNSWEPFIEPATKNQSYKVVSIPDGSYAIRFIDPDGNLLLRVNTVKGEIPDFDAPIDPPEGKEFDTWNPTLVAATKDTTYMAVWKDREKPQKPSPGGTGDPNTPSGGEIENTGGKEYTIQFVNDDGTVLQTVKVKEGDTPEYILDIPSPSDGSSDKSFFGWEPDIVPATADATYTATYAGFEELPGTPGGWDE